MFALHDLITMKPKEYHVSTLSKFRYDERTPQPYSVAATDSFDQFIIERVIEMKGRPRGSKSQIYFKIRWAGLSEAEDTWLSWKDGFRTTAVQNFLFFNNVPDIKRLGLKDYNPDEPEDEEVFRGDSDEEP